jgi:hypothetical protein
MATFNMHKAGNESHFPKFCCSTSLLVCVHALVVCGHAAANYTALEISGQGLHSLRLWPQASSVSPVDAKACMFWLAACEGHMAVYRIVV